VEALGGALIVAVGGAAGQAEGEGGTFLEGAEGDPEGVLDRTGLVLQERVGGVGVPGAAAEAEDILLVELEESAAALRAGEGGGDAGAAGVVEGLRLEFGDVGLALHVVG